MEPSYFEQFIQFAKYCAKEKFVAAFKGVLFGFIGSLKLLWSGEIAGPLVILFLKGLGTVLITASTTFISCYISYRFDLLKEKDNDEPKRPKKERRKKAA